MLMNHVPRYCMVWLAVSFLNCNSSPSWLCMRTYTSTSLRSSRFKVNIHPGIFLYLMRGFNGLHVIVYSVTDFNLISEEDKGGD